MALTGERIRPDSPARETIRATVLLIEDDPAIRRLLRASFEDTGLKLVEAENGKEGVELATRKSPDLILLDIGLPDMSGLEIVQLVRGWSKIPIIMLTAQGQERVKVECLEAGADDYVTKPFGVSELIARIRATIRRSLTAASENGSSVFESGALRVDFASREVLLNGERIRVTPLEYKLLAALIRHAGKVVTHRQLLTEVWGPEYAEESQYLRLYVGYLRKKLEREDIGERYILNEPGVGYRFVV